MDLSDGFEPLQRERGSKPQFPKAELEVPPVVALWRGFSKRKRIMANDQNRTEGQQNPNQQDQQKTGQQAGQQQRQGGQQGGQQGEQQGGQQGGQQDNQSSDQDNSKKSGQ